MNSLKIGLTILGSALAGYTTAYLTAPRSGKKTRKLIKNEFDATKQALEEAAHVKLNEAKSLLNQTIETQAESGKQVIDNVKENIKVA